MALLGKSAASTTCVPCPTLALQLPCPLACYLPLPAGYNVLSASDAVGMGLNLAIRRVVFTSLRKFDGTQERQLTTAEIKQVQGAEGVVGL